MCCLGHAIKKKSTARANVHPENASKQRELLEWSRGYYLGTGRWILGTSTRAKVKPTPYSGQSVIYTPSIGGFFNPMDYYRSYCAQRIGAMIRSICSPGKRGKINLKTESLLGEMIHLQVVCRVIYDWDLLALRNYCEVVRYRIIVVATYCGKWIMTVVFDNWLLRSVEQA